jgi:antitoxin HigA-1
MKNRLKLIPPGEILLKEFLEPLGIGQNQLARDLDVPVTRISDIVHAKRGISADTALRLAAYFGTTPDFWMNLQTRYDLKKSARERWPRIKKRIRPCAAANAIPQ